MTAKVTAILSIVLAEGREEGMHLSAKSDPLKEHFQ